MNTEIFNTYILQPIFKSQFKQEQELLVESLDKLKLWDDKETTKTV
jgi:hypothetical protein